MSHRHSSSLDEMSMVDRRRRKKKKWNDDLFSCHDPFLVFALVERQEMNLTESMTQLKVGMIAKDVRIDTHEHHLLLHDGLRPGLDFSD
ncbi:hypothetical protein Tco_0746865 [Tanacetum coccineum]